MNDESCWNCGCYMAEWWNEEEEEDQFYCVNPDCSEYDGVDNDES